MASLDENQMANFIGSFAYFEMVQCLSAGLCYGIAVSLFYVSFRVSVERHQSTSRAKICLLGLTCFMFLLTTGAFVTNVSCLFVMFSWARDTVTESTPSLKDRLLAVDTATVPYDICGVIFQTVNFLIGDAIVIWRAVVLWPQSRLIRSGLCLLFLGNAAVSFYDVVNFCIVTIRSAEVNTTSWISPDAIRILVSMGVNLVATLCIAVKAWQFRATLRLGFSRAIVKNSFANQVMTLIVECGLIFCAIQILYAIHNLVILPKTYVSPKTSSLALYHAVMQSFFPLVSGIYPSIVIVVMAKRRSVFGTSTFVACSDDPPAADIHESQVLSTLHCATRQDWSSSRSPSISENTGGSKDGVDVSFKPIGDQAV